MEYFFLFKNGRTAEVAAIRAVNSDKALLKLLAEKGWPIEAIIYEGKKPIHPDMENR